MPKGDLWIIHAGSFGCISMSKFWPRLDKFHIRIFTIYGMKSQYSMLR